MSDAAQSPQVFRPRKLLAVMMGGAAVWWLGVLVYLTQFDRVPAKTFLIAGSFVLFFAASFTYYARSAVRVDHEGVTFQGMLHARRLSFEDIQRVNVLPGPVTVYAVGAPGVWVHFTSFFAHHRQLMELLVRRARLDPNA